MSPRKTAISIPNGRQWVTEEDKRAVIEALDADMLTQGPMVERFEEALAKYCGAHFAVTFSSGTAALHAACVAAGLKVGDEAITSPISFVASANCISYTGAEVRFADVDPTLAQVIPETLAACITRRTRVMIPVDFAGRPCDHEAIYRLAKENNIIVIDDAAHALGAAYKTKNDRGGLKTRIGSCLHADMTCFSFHPVKSITTIEGGAVTTNSEEMRDRLVRFRKQGITYNPLDFKNRKHATGEWYHEMQELGYNYRLGDVSCALGLSQLKTLDQRIAMRRKIATTYREILGESIGMLAADDRNHASAHHLFVVLLEKELRDAVFAGMRKMGIGVQLHYIPIYRQPYYQEKLNIDPARYPCAEKYFSQAMSLPIWPGLSDEQVQTVVDGLHLLMRKQSHISVHASNTARSS